VSFKSPNDPHRIRTALHHTVCGSFQVPGETSSKACYEQQFNSLPNADDRMLGRWKTNARPSPALLLLLIGLIVCLLLGTAEASIGDHLPQFRECVQVRHTLAHACPRRQETHYSPPTYRCATVRTAIRRITQPTFVSYRRYSLPLSLPLPLLSSEERSSSDLQRTLNGLMFLPSP
jgi:hypothetical protein